MGSDYVVNSRAPSGNATTDDSVSGSSFRTHFDTGEVPFPFRTTPSFFGHRFRFLSFGYWVRLTVEKSTYKDLREKELRARVICPRWPVACWI